MNKRSGLFILIAALLLIFSLNIPAFGADSVSLEDSLNEIVSYYENNITDLNDWEVIGLANAGVDLSVYTWQLPDWNLDSANASVGDYAKAILAIKAIRQDPTDVNGRDLCQELASKQDPGDGHFGDWFTEHIWSVKALDESGSNYNVTQAIDYIISSKKSDGGYAVSGDVADPDTTGFTLIALANHTEINGVSEAITGAKNCVHSLQLDTGGFSSTIAESAESDSAVIRGLLACGFNEIITREDWTRNDNTMIDALYAFQLEDKSFAHELAGESNRMATYQSLLAITDLVNNGFGSYLINRGSSNNDPNEPSGEIGVTVRVEGLENTGTILEGTGIEVAAGSKVFDALKKTLDDAGIGNSIDPEAEWLDISDIDADIPQELSSSLYWMYVVNDDLNTGANLELNQDDKVTAYLSYYDSEWSTAYARLTVDKEDAKKGDTVTVTVEKSDGGWPAGYIPAEGASVHFGNETYTTDENGQVAVTVQTAGTYEVYAEKYTEAGLPEIVKTAKIIITVDESSSGPISGSKNITVQIAVVGGQGELLYGPGSATVSEDGEFGLTAMGALDAAGVSYRFSSKWDSFIESIAGIDNEGLSGWCFKVNGVVPSVLAVDKTISQGDKIIFWYSTDAMSDGPSWQELERGTVIPSQLPPVEEEEQKEVLKGYSSDLDTLINGDSGEGALNSNKILVKNADKKMTEEKANDLKGELAKNTVNLKEEVGEKEKLVADNEVSILIPEKALSGSKELTVEELTTNEEPKQFAVKLGSSTYEFGPSGTEFDKPVTIGINIPVTEDINIESLAPAWYDENNKQWIPVPGIIDLETGLVVFRIDHFTKFAVISLPERNSFADLGAVEWARDAVEILAGQGIINGTGSGFEPQRPITRAEFVKLIIEAAGCDFTQYPEGLFKDVNPADWFAEHIAGAYENNLITGYPDGTFRPDNIITRNEIAVIFAKLTNEEIDDDIGVDFNDKDSIPVWAFKGVSYVFDQGLMQGYEDGNFKGDNFLTRAEAAVTIYRYLSNLHDSTVI